MHNTRDQFKHASLLTTVRSAFDQKTQKKHNSISTTDCLMSGLAVFALKYPSLLKFDEDKMSEPQLRHNLDALYGIKKAPCDTYLRERLDGQDLSVPRKANAKLLAVLQRSGVLKEWKFLDGKFLISLDATGFFSSNEVHCEHCCTKIVHKGTEKEKVTYNHQMLVGAIVSPNKKQVFPIAFEPIIKEDGDTKNDCERNCAKRWLEIFRKSHPHLPTIIVADGLYSNAPFIKAATEKNCSYILVAKETDHKFLYPS